LGHDDTALNAFLTAHFEPGKRVDTNVSATWEEEARQVRLGQDDNTSPTHPATHLEPGRDVDTDVGESSGKAN
jgi:hypothetical protein